MAYTEAGIGAKTPTVKQVRKTAALLDAKIGSGGGSGISDAPVDGEAYVRKDEGWAALNNLTETVNVGLADAPDDGKVYVRTEESWVAVNLNTETVTTTLTDAPDDGYIYVRQSGEWVKLDTSLASA
ncbi:MAG: hypothetical protein IJU98_07675 [Synergistaceae bacterium]|nr:hypothetical protein [Synergistaceae bacterium]